MKKVNILHVASFYTMGGIENILGDFLIKAKKGFKFHVFSPYPILKHWQQQFERHKIPFYQGVMKNRWDREIVNIARRCKADIVHFHWGVAQGKALKKNGVKLIIAHDHGMVWKYHPSAIGFIKKEYQYVDRIISVSNASRLMLNQRLDIDLDKIITIYNGFNYERIKPVAPISSPNGNKVVLTIGRLEKQKGIDSLLKAIPEIIKERKDVEFWIVGDGSLRKNFVSLGSELGVTEYLKFWGAQKAVGNFLSSATILVLPSIWEPFGNVLVEAGYLKKPCIATNIDGIPEIVIHRETGILIDPVVPVIPDRHLPLAVLDGRRKSLRQPLKIAPEDLGKSILELLNNPELSESMGENAYQRVVQLFNFQNYQEQLWKIYQGEL